MTPQPHSSADTYPPDKPNHEPRPGGQLPGELPPTTPGGPLPNPGSDTPIDEPTEPASGPDYLPGSPTNPNTHY